MDCNVSSRNEKRWGFTNNTTRPIHLLYINQLKISKAFNGTLSLDNNSYSLIISSVRCDHEGMYTCFEPEIANLSIYSLIVIGKLLRLHT